MKNGGWFFFYPLLSGLTTPNTAGGKDIRGIDEEVKTQQAKRDNFDKVLSFLASQRVRTSTVTSRDLAAGNLKSLMRLILSLASHYKPHSVKQGRDSGKNENKNYQKIPQVAIIYALDDMNKLHTIPFENGRFSSFTRYNAFLSHSVHNVQLLTAPSMRRLI